MKAFGLLCKVKRVFNVRNKMRLQKDSHKTSMFCLCLFVFFSEVLNFLLLHAIAKCHAIKNASAPPDFFHYYFISLYLAS